MNKKVLVLSTYPFKVPRHGGQVRLSNICKAYTDAGYTVISRSVYQPEIYTRGEANASDVAFPSDSEYRLFNGRNIPFIADLQTGDYASSDMVFHKTLKNLDKGFDVIHVEQPWLWSLAQRLRETAVGNTAIAVFGSQNIEAKLKESIMIDQGVVERTEVIAAIDRVERRAACEADIVLAVTSSDLEVLRSFGANNLVLAENGIAPWQADPKLLAKWREKLPDAPWILYVASAHPPNFTNFLDIMGDSLASIPPDSRLVVAGSVGEPLRTVLMHGHWNELSVSRLQVLGTLSDADLAAVKSLSTAFLVPIAAGGGSNLKTAEALYSGAYVVATPQAFRGYDNYSSLPGVSICDNPKSIHAAIREVLSKYAEPHELPRGYGELQELTWESRLGKFIEALQLLTEQRRN
jgi:glycosyltransferase involved in cell wall biosynthesis